ncbi:COX15/CtaA family protein [Henriciella aquimarina]|uniref:COX15/CtaA family protein n=1 Tax=Henriciella aquimarina TaxID=545261 RepID=UPI001F2AA4D7|nr:COX15/CtaA family protein [Henriciella aquimarina]
MRQMAKSETATRWIRRWLILIALMVYAIILVGGMTRLTDSGLSITEWDPISGALPPLGADAWAQEFAKYRQTAEFQQQNYNMTLSEFQYIYWWEWGHRLFGRLIGLVAVGGLVWFWMKGWLNRSLASRFVVLILLGGLQGAIGWWMVSSGIGETDRLDVAPYRLATHFSLALVIIGYTVWLWLDLGERGRMQLEGWRGRLPWILLALIFTQMVTGALVAGLDAGRTYTDWPLMMGQVVPPNYLEPDLGVRSLFEGRAATQFNHRYLAYAIWFVSLAAVAVSWGRTGWREMSTLATLVTVQAAWGIFTLIHAAPLEMAILHQALGVVVFITALRLAWLTLPSAAQRSVSG